MGKDLEMFLFLVCEAVFDFMLGSVCIFMGLFVICMVKELFGRVGFIISLGFEEIRGIVNDWI